jgi:signal transduction histidine kinase
MNEITHHDILNAVSGIFGCLDLITGPASEAERYTLLSEIRNRTTTIHGHILFTWDYQNVGVKAPRWNDVKVLVTSVAELFKTSPVDIQTEISDTEVFADPMLERVIYNLIDNALRYGEQITWIRFFLRMENHGLTIVCEDDGAGIPQEMKETIFNRGVGNNTGLGLFLTREILGITGMTIRETGEPGKGARFEITVPPEQFRSSSGSHCM